MKIKSIHWKLLLSIKEIYKSFNPLVDSITVSSSFTAIKSNLTVLPNDSMALVRFSLNNNNLPFFEIAYAEIAPKKLKKIFSLYLGYILVNKSAKTPFTCAHFAQTIDGKIATITGKSKWIGNQENLVHSHRIRALVDAILIGGNTYRIDKPKLNVRLVSGSNPVKIIIANSKLDLANLSEGRTYIFSNNDLVYENLPHETEVINLNNTTGFISSKILLEYLKQKGIHSILIEGGARTIREFIEEKMLSRIEFHSAPMIFGSGKNSIELDEIQELDQAILLKKPMYFKIGNAIMTVSNL